MASTLVQLATQAMALDELPPCRRQNAQLWFSDLPAELQLAKAYCQPCPLRRACLSGAVERHEPHGVWGGEIFACGAIITDKRPPGRPPRTEGRAKPELPTRRSSLADHAGLACAGQGPGPVGRAEIAQDVAGVLLHVSRVTVSWLAMTGRPALSASRSPLADGSNRPGTALRRERVVQRSSRSGGESGTCSSRQRLPRPAAIPLVSP
jgi:WhiB family transcriptional regulator, redox-sensing transcriptional regulator